MSNAYLEGWGGLRYTYKPYKPISHMGCSQNDGPLLVMEYTTAPSIEGYQNSSLILGNPNITTPVIPVINSLPKAPNPSSKPCTCTSQRLKPWAPRMGP